MTPDGHNKQLVRGHHRVTKLEQRATPSGAQQTRRAVGKTPKPTPPPGAAAEQPGGSHAQTPEAKTHTHTQTRSAEWRRKRKQCNFSATRAFCTPSTARAMPGFSLASRPAERPVPLLTQSFKQAHGRVEKKKRKIDTATSQTDQSLDRGRRSDSKAPAASLLPLNYYYRQQGPIARGDRQSAPDKTMRKKYAQHKDEHARCERRQATTMLRRGGRLGFFFCFVFSASLF